MRDANDARKGVAAQLVTENDVTVYIDPPIWPGHGHLWSHLISDQSYQELHDFAARIGIPRRGFERDHYDVIAERYGAGTGRRRAAGVVARDCRTADRGRLASPAPVTLGTARQPGKPTSAPVEQQGRALRSRLD